MSIDTEDGGPTIVVNTSERIPVERWIFSAAHEIEHLLLHLNSFDKNEHEEEDEQENEANSFAYHLLMPGSIFNQEWSESLSLTFIDRVFKMKRMFRVNYATVLYRLYEHGQLHMRESFFSQYRRRYGQSLSRKIEPKPLSPEAFKKVIEDKVTCEPKRLDESDVTEDCLNNLM